MTSRRWSWTLNNYTVDEEVHIMDLADKCKYLVFGREIAPETGTPHLQGYVEFHTPKRLAGVKKLIGDRAHIEISMGTAEDNRKYCLKIDDEGVVTNDEWCEFGKPGEGRGKRSDLVSMRDAAINGATMADLIDSHPKQVAKYMKFAERCISIGDYESTKNRERPMTVTVLWGGAGTGKTYAAHSQEENLFTVNCTDTFPFDGYEGQAAICLDDFYGGIPYHYLLRVLHGWQLRVPVKGGHRYARWERVYITSNKPPHEWYSHGLTDALKRRIHKVIHFADRPIADAVETEAPTWWKEGPASENDLGTFSDENVASISAPTTVHIPEDTALGRLISGWWSRAGVTPRAPLPDPIETDNIAEPPEGWLSNSHYV